MPGNQKLEFIIRPDGRVEETVTGIQGPDCERVTEGIEQALGTVVNRERSADYFNTQSDENTIPNQQ